VASSGSSTKRNMSVRSSRCPRPRATGRSIGANNESDLDLPRPAKIRKLGIRDLVDAKHIPLPKNNAASLMIRLEKGDYYVRVRVPVGRAKVPRRPPYELSFRAGPEDPPSAAKERWPCGGRTSPPLREDS